MSFPSSRFKGHVPKEIISLGVMRIERVGGATAVTHHPSVDDEPIKRYDIVGGCIQRPERGPPFQFLVVEIGGRLVFEGEGPEVFIAGTIASEAGKSLRARDCVGVPAARA